MRIDILTLFPGMFENGPLQESMLKRAQEDKRIELHIHDLKDWGLGNYRQVDDKPYGGGAGMLLRSDVVIPAIEEVTKQGQNLMQKFKSSIGMGGKPRRIYLSARGEALNQQKVEGLAAHHDWLLLLCGHYEGVDQRVMEGGHIDEEIRIGDYVLTGGELPAMVLIDAVARYIPGVLGAEESTHEESFSSALEGKQEYPHYTRPEEYKGLRVPDVLLSGHHGEIEEWRKQNRKG